MATNATPLAGVKVLELSGLAPGPFCGLLLASYGASVVRIDRPNANTNQDLLTTHKSSIALDLKSPPSAALFKTLIEKTDVLIDPYRPGVLERMGFDPVTVLQKINPRLIVVRLTGFRKEGKYKDMAGHDINYLAVSGVLSLLGEKDKPPLPPVNLLADFAGGGHVAFTGVLLALIARSVNGKGQIVDANMVDGANYLGTFPRLLLKTPAWNGPKGTNQLDGGAPFYGCYECKDKGRYMSVGALEPQFFAAMIKGLGLTHDDCVPPHSGYDRFDSRSWDYMRHVFDYQFRTKTRKEWEAIFDGTDACCTPVLTNDELEQSNFELRPIVGLDKTPGREITDKWEGRPFAPGEGGEKALKEWMGWSKGRDYEINSKGTWEKKERSKL